MSTPESWELATPVFGIRYPKPTAPASKLPDAFGHIGADLESALISDEATPPGLNYVTGTNAQRLAATPAKDLIWVVTDVAGNPKYIGTGTAWIALANPTRVSAPVAVYNIAGTFANAFVYSGFTVTPNVPETTDSSFIIGNTGSVFSMRKGLYGVHFMLNLPAVTGRTLVQVLSSITRARNSIAVTEDAGSTFALVPINTDGVGIECSVYKNASGDATSGRIMFVRFE